MNVLDELCREETIRRFQELEPHLRYAWNAITHQQQHLSANSLSSSPTPKRFTIPQPHSTPLIPPCLDLPSCYTHPNSKALHIRICDASRTRSTPVRDPGWRCRSRRSRSARRATG